jgi:YHS domain-containing protein
VTRFLLLFVLIVVAARFFWRLIEVVLKGAMGPAAQTARRGGGPPSSVKMQPCPVCGTYVVPGKAISAVSGGAQVYFCSEKCRAEFRPA